MPRSSRMRGYGSWSIGWKESSKERTGESFGCGFITLIFAGLIIYFLIATVIESGFGFGAVFCLALLSGLFQGYMK